MALSAGARRVSFSLNESPSEKEGKFLGDTHGIGRGRRPSMKVPPKRKGNLTLPLRSRGVHLTPQ